MKHAFLFLGAVLCVATSARADLVVGFQERKLAGDVTTEATGEITMGKDRMAAGMDGVKGAPAPVRYVYRGDLQVLWTEQPLWKWYSQEDSVMAAAARSIHKGDTPDDVEARILQRPAAERAQAEADERARQAAATAATAAAAAVHFSAANVTETIGGFACSRWDAAALHAAGAQPEWRVELWVAPWSAVGITPEECAVALDMGRTLEHWWGGTPADGRLVFALRALPQVGGFPVCLRQFRDGKLVTEYTFTGVRRQDVTPGLYVLPPGFVRREG